MNALQGPPPPRPGRWGRRLLTGAALWLAISGAAAETIMVGGTGAALGTMQLLAAEFKKVVPAYTVVVVRDLGSRGGLKALAAGAIDMAVITRPLNAGEAAQGLVGMHYGKTPFVVATSTRGTSTLDSLEDLADIYAGRRVTWSQGERVRLVMRPPSGSDMRLLQALSPELTRAIPAAMARPGMIVASTDQEAVDFIENTPGAIGTTTLALVRSEKRNVRLAPLGGVVPSPASLADGTYPYAREMVLVRKGAGKQGAARFFEFVASARGRHILADTGHWVAGLNPTR